MFGRGIRLFEIFGFAVKIDASWLILAVLVTWSLAGRYFPGTYQDLSPAVYLWMGVAGAAGLFASIVFHELSHSLVARRYGMPIRGITLFIFGGVAEMEDEPPTAQAEFRMAIAGPVASGVLAVSFHVLGLVGEGIAAPVPILGVFGWLAFVNTMLAVFNLVPAFPLDGGRMLRAALWHWRGNLQWATRVAANAGSLFGYVLIGLGLISFIYGDVINGVWFALIGMFLRAAASSSYMQIQTRQVFEGEPVQRFMVRDVVTVPPDITVQRLVSEYVYVHYHELFPVVDASGLRGCVGVAQIKLVPRDKWEVARVFEIMSPATAENTVDAGVNAIDALKLMRRTGNSRLMVREGGRLVGLVTLKDLLHLIGLKMNLEGRP